MPLEPMVSMMLDWEITKTRIGTIIMTTVAAAEAPERAIVPFVIWEIA